MRTPNPAIAFYATVLAKAISEVKGEMREIENELRRFAKRLTVLQRHAAPCKTCGHKDNAIEADTLKQDMREVRSEYHQYTRLFSALEGGHIRLGRSAYRQTDAALDAVEQALFLNQM